MTSAPMTLRQCSAHALPRAADRPAIELDQQCYRWGDMRRVADAISAALDASDAGPDAPIGCEAPKETAISE